MSSSTGRLPPETWADVQGLITSGYGSLPFSAYLWLAIAAPGARRWLAETVPLVRASADAPASKDSRDGGESALNLAFTAQGLAAMGLPDEVVHSFPPEFVEGMAAADRSLMLGDTGESAPEHWVVGGPSTPTVGAVVVVHGRTEEAVERACADVRGRLASAAGAVFEIGSSEQRGHRSQGREPFGFRDGIAQPAIRGRKGHGVPTGEFILGYPNHYGFLPPTPVVPTVLDPDGRLPPWPNPHHSRGSLRDFGKNGSYLVYRKLKQDVAGFWRFASDEAARLTAAGHAETAVTLASKMVGRWPEGTPLAGTSPPEHSGPADLDAFSYGHDLDGLACPWGAHIRRTHPRDAIKPYGPEASLHMSEAHRLLRRGRVFGPLLFDAEALGRRGDAAALERLGALQDDGRERGVHFLCINASIRSQFEFVQQSWCNNRRFAGLSDDPDPIAGDTGRPNWPSYMTLPRPEGAVRTSALPRFVTVRGGAYLFVPSLAALGFVASMR